MEKRIRCCTFASAGFDPTLDQVVNMAEMQASLDLGLSKDPLDMVILVFLLSSGPIIITVMGESEPGKSNYNCFLDFC